MGEVVFRDILTNPDEEYHLALADAIAEGRIVDHEEYRPTRTVQALRRRHDQEDSDASLDDLLGALAWLIEYEQCGLWE